MWGLLARAEEEEILGQLRMASSLLYAQTDRVLPQMNGTDLKMTFNAI